MADHVVLIGPIDHDGARYEEGSQVAIGDEAAADLVALGVIGEAIAGHSHKPASKAKATEA